MRTLTRCSAALAAALLAQSCAPHSRQDIDPQIRAEIGRTKAIDNHAHPMRAFAVGDPDHDYDALPVDAMQPSPSPVRLDPSNPEYRLAWRNLFSYDGSDERRAAEAKERVTRERGDGYPPWVLDRMNTDIMLANRVRMGHGLPQDRFKWVPFADPLIFPLNNDSLGARDPDRKTFFTAETNLLHRYLSDSGQTALPASLDGYLHFATSVLERQKSQGAVAEKFEIAYLRRLDFGTATRADADRIYAAHVKGGTPSDADYKGLQDFLFRYVAAECGRLGMPVHVHSFAGVGAYFDASGANPILMEPVFDDPALQNTKFVMIHGGWPFTREMGALLGKRNVWADFSLQTLVRQPRDLSGTLRAWLEFMPDRLLFGTDASPETAAVGWEETGWLSAESGRDALGMALTGMVRDREIDAGRASELARMVLRDNARRLYGWK
jgi:predicted TIM-barrel fold metal-dependent hydrolase